MDVKHTVCAQLHIYRVGDQLAIKKQEFIEVSQQLETLGSKVDLGRVCKAIRDDSVAHRKAVFSAPPVNSGGNCMCIGRTR